VENEFFVLPFESSITLSIQNHLQHGRSLAALYTCLQSEEVAKAFESGGSDLKAVEKHPDFVGVLQLISKDSYSLQLIIAALRHAVTCIDGGFYKFPSDFFVDSASIGSDVMTPVIQSICDDISKGSILSRKNAGIRQLHEMMCSILGSLLQAEEEDARATGTSTWVLLNALNEHYDFGRDDQYVETLARENNWIYFLAECEKHSYSPKEVFSFANFANRELRAHIQRALLMSTGFPSECQDNDGSSSPPELFSLMSNAEKDESPAAFLLHVCLQWRWPFLAVLASCYDDVDKVNCFKHWILTTCLPKADSEDISRSVENGALLSIVSALCRSKCYLPLIRAGEIFYPRSAFVTFIYFLHSFMQTRISDAESYLSQYKEITTRMARSRRGSSAGAGSAGKGDVNSEEWMLGVTIALESSLGASSSNSFERNKALELFASCGLLDDFPRMKTVHALYDILGEQKYSSFVFWHVPTDVKDSDGGREYELLQCDTERAITFLEDHGRWKEARELGKRCGLNTEDAVLHHAKRLLEEAMGSNIYSQTDIIEVWKSCHTLFLESSVPNHRIGAFFLEQFNEHTDQLTTQEKLVVFRFAHKWYSGAFRSDRVSTTTASSTDASSSTDLDRIAFRGLICCHEVDG